MNGLSMHLLRENHDVGQLLLWTELIENEKILCYVNVYCSRRNENVIHCVCGAGKWIDIEHG